MPSVLRHSRTLCPNIVATPLTCRSQEDDFEFDILDATKIWPQELVPIQYVGELELNRNPDEYFTQTEQVAFCTGHVPPGMSKTFYIHL